MDAALTIMVKKAVAEAVTGSVKSVIKDTVATEMQSIMDTMEISVGAGVEQAFEASGKDLNQFGKRERDQLDSLNTQVTELTKQVTSLTKIVETISSSVTRYQDKILWNAAQERLIRTFNYAATVDHHKKHKATPPSPPTSK